jgi:hypothetical protein
MSEEQLRDVLARVVPEAPDSVADPAPVVRAARTRRRAQVALAGGAVALVAIAGVLGGRALVEDDPGPQVADEGSLSGDPYSAAACPEVLPASGPLPDLSKVKAVRYCAAGLNGFPATPGPPDALVYGIDDFATLIDTLPAADPARCAAVDVIPSDSRLAYELADGSMVFTPVTMCTDVTVGDRTVDGAEVGQTFFAALDSQRYVDDYALEPAEIDLNCQTPTSSGPAQPGREQLIAVAICPADDPESLGGALASGSDDSVEEAWATATSLDPSVTCEKFDPTPSLVALTDRGDVVRLEGSPCGYLLFYGWENEQPPYQIPFDATGLSGS